MTALHLILRVESVLSVMFGLWSHSWLLIAAGLVCWCVYPLIGREISRV